MQSQFQFPRSKMLFVVVLCSVIFSSAFGFLAGIVAADPVVRNVVWSTFGLVSKDNSQPTLRIQSTEEAQRIDVVKRVAPAVVSIVVSKDVPKVEQYMYSPFGDSSDFFSQFFGGNVQVPGYRENGTEKREIGAGSGFIVSEDGYIITNKHVVSIEDAEYTVVLNDGTKHSAKVLARDPSNDIAILKVDAVALPTLQLGDSDSLDVGQSVIAIGYALGRFGNTVSTGIVSGLERSIHAGNGQSAEDLFGVIQTDTAINPGNSGGPLLGMNGAVIGVNVAIVEGSQNIGFALPINDVKKVYESVKATGKISRPFVGVRYQMIDEELKSANALSVDYGAWVIGGTGVDAAAVLPGSPADKAGILENDIILEVNGKKLTLDYPLAVSLRPYKVGDKISLKILRKGEEKTIEVELSERPL